MQTTDGGRPTNWISNLRLVSTFELALCNRKLNCHPLFKYISMVLFLSFPFLSFANFTATNSVGRSTRGTVIVEITFLLGLFNEP